MDFKNKEEDGWKGKESDSVCYNLNENVAGHPWKFHVKRVDNHPPMQTRRHIRRNDTNMGSRGTIFRQIVLVRKNHTGNVWSSRRIKYFHIWRYFEKEYAHELKIFWKNFNTAFFYN